MIDRRAALGASDATIVVNGAPAQIHNLWLYKTGQKDEDDLSLVIPVQIGICTEPLNIRLFEHKTKLTVTRQQERVSRPGEDWLVATLDGHVGDAVVEAKHVNQFSKIDDIVSRYLPQLHVQMWCAGVEKAYLSVLIGTFAHEIVPVEYDWIYGSQVIDACRAFWKHVTDRTSPGNVEVVGTAPVAATRVEDMTGNNYWSSYAAWYRETKAAAAKHDEAKRMLKGLVQPDVVKAHGHGIIVTRSKSGSLTIKEN